MQRSFYDLEKEEISSCAVSKGWPAYRVEQIWSWQGRAVESYSEMSNLPAELRLELENDFPLGGIAVDKSLRSSDGQSEKFALRLADGNLSEAVLMRYRYGDSLCLSTQLGCRMGCQFCASRQTGFDRQLSRGEMLGQFLRVEKASGKKVKRLDLMGVGEPLDNYEEVLAFIRRLQAHEGIGLSPRRVCLSTCGLVPEMRKLAGEGLPLTLSVSLHAPNQKLRERLMPAARIYPYEDVLAAARYYFSRSGRRVSYEYALFQMVNDRVEDARELASRLKRDGCHVNLIPANPVPGSGLKASKRERVEAFRAELEKRHIPVTVRRSLGLDIDAACGQLRRRLLAEEKA